MKHAMNTFVKYSTGILCVMTTSFAQDSNPFEQKIQIAQPSEIPSTPLPSPTLTLTETPAATSITVTPSITVPSGTPSARPQTMLELSIEMAEANQKLKPSTANQFLLSTLLDKLVNETCLRDRQETIQASDLSPACKDAISKAETLDSGLPSITCAKEGLGSQSCALAYAEQRSAIYQNESDYRSAELDDRFKPIEENQFSTLFDQLTSSTPELKDKAASQMILLACRGIVVGPLKANNQEDSVTIIDQPTPLPTTENGTSIDMSGILSRLSDETPTPALPNITFKRIRLISAQCNEAIETVMRELPDSAKGTCIQKGFYTPACLEAERAEIQSKVTPTPEITVKSGKPVAPSKTKGFETF